MTIMFLNSSPKILKQAIVGPKISHFFRKILQLDKFEGADFKYDNILFKFQPKSLSASASR